MKARRDSVTPDLFRDYEPRPVVVRYAPERVRAATCAARVARAVAEALKECGLSRDVAAQKMSDFLGETVTTNMLAQYSAPSNSSHNIPAHRLVALLQVTGDLRLINALLADTDCIAVDSKYEALIVREMAKEAIDRLNKEVAASDARWRARR